MTIAVTFKLRPPFSFVNQTPEGLSSRPKARQFLIDIMVRAELYFLKFFKTLFGHPFSFEHAFPRQVKPLTRLCM